jgi:hypothetical protein
MQECANKYEFSSNSQEESSMMGSGRKYAKCKLRREI